MKNLLAIGLACCLPAGLAAENPNGLPDPLGEVSVLVFEDSAPVATGLPCARSAADRGGSQAQCMAMHRAVLTARIQKVPVLRERGHWM